MTLPDGTNPIEPKVKVQAIVTYVLGVVMVAVLGAVNDNNLISVLPDWASMFIGPIIPTLIALAAAYNARHQYRAGEFSDR